MTQDVSNNQRDSAPLANSTSIQPWSVDKYADQLMDDLFADIDRVLEGGSISTPEQPQSEYISLQPVQVSQVTLPPTWVPPEELLPEQPDNTPRSIVQTPLALDISVEEIQPEDNKDRGEGKLFEKLLLGLALTSAAATLLLWLVSQGRLNWLFSPPATVTPVSQEVQSKADEQFVNYMQRSLEVIDRKADANKRTGSAAAPQGTNLPPVTTVPGNTAGAARGSGVMERVYIPIYPSPQSQSVVPQSALGLQGVSPLVRPPLLPSLPRRPVPPVRPAPSVSSMLPVRPAPSVSSMLPVRPKPPVSRPAPSVRPSAPSLGSKPLTLPPMAATMPRLPIPALPPLAPPAPPAPPAAVPAPNPDPAPTATHTLVGVLELGDRSAALFDFGGVANRIRVGENIGSSGWTLVSISNQEAVIRRNGEVRSVYVGQKF
ncbi:hypothetical protein [Coleofasciculus sp. FACHB-T130]|uniref:hypothetical protein n=1 Tax=Cyanophyceae TaxID=3028117 RepID=UPI001685904D|nr:hypothetical protein [Coleofasciculus sp. FACHB-T130]MBD1879408.1 hypothetical protein [Coleofasciculus sp. FACHB-T130]